MQIARIEFCKKNRIAVKFCRLRQFKKLKKTQFAIANCASQSTEIEKKRNRAIRNCELRQPIDRFRKKMKERNPQLQIAPASRPNSKKNEITQFAIADFANQVTEFEKKRNHAIRNCGLRQPSDPVKVRIKIEALVIKP